MDQTKICRVCKVEKPLTSYHPNKTCSFGVVGTCKVCSSERIKGWYADNRERRQEVANSYNRKRKKKIVDHFGNKCHDCENVFPQYVYQFHHLDPSSKDVNPSYAITSNPNKMWKELEKCVMLCANCHMIRHHKDND